MIKKRQAEHHGFFSHIGATERTVGDRKDGTTRPKKPVVSNQPKLDLRKADLVQANLDMIDLHGADLSRANLAGASLKRTNLQGADLSWADLRETDLSRANLRDVDLRFANLGDVSALSQVVNWKQVHLWRNCNIYGIYNAPKGFRQWAMALGAIEVWLPELGLTSYDNADLDRSHSVSSWKGSHDGSVLH